MSFQRRTFTIALAVIGLGWGLAFGGFNLARQLKTTLAKVQAFLHSTDFAHLSGPARAQALKRLAAMLNALTLEERQQARLQGELNRWIQAMTDSEKGDFMEATLPVGFQQMISAFEQLPEAKRREAIAASLRNLREAQNRATTNEPPDLAAADGPAAPVWSPELQEKAVKMGLQTFYDTSSPTMKVEVAPLLEALQESMNSGRLFRVARFGREPGP